MRIAPLPELHNEHLPFLIRGELLKGGPLLISDACSVYRAPPVPNVVQRLEVDLPRQLNQAWVVGSSFCSESMRVEIRSDAVRIELGVIKEVEKLESQFDLYTLHDLDVLHYAKVEVVEARATQKVAACVPLRAQRRSRESAIRWGKPIVGSLLH